MNAKRLTFIFFICLVLSTLTMSCVASNRTIKSSQGEGWVVNWFGSGNSTCGEIAVDGDGYVYTTGDFIRSLDLDPGPDTIIHHARKERLQFLIQLDPEAEFQWGNTWPAIGFGGDNFIAIDDNNKIYVLGKFNDAFDFDPGPGVELVTTNVVDTFLCKIDTNGSLIWVRSTESLHGSCSPSGIALDDAGDIYIAGSFIGELHFNSSSDYTSITSNNGFFDVFLCKYDSSGQFQWVQTWGGSRLDVPMGIAAGNTSKVYVTGSIGEATDFDPGPGVEIQGEFDHRSQFLSIFNTEGDFLRVYTGEGIGNLIDLDSDGNLYTTGTFSDSCDLDPGEGEDIHISHGRGIFLSKMDQQDNFLWARSWGSPDASQASNMPYAIDVNTEDMVYVAGKFYETVDFDSSSGTDIHLSNGDEDAFVTCYDTDGNYLWTQTWGGSGDDSARSVITFRDEVIYIAGGFTGEFDYSSKIGLHVIDSETFINNYLLKLSADGSF